MPCAAWCTLPFQPRLPEHRVSLSDGSILGCGGYREGQSPQCGPTRVRLPWLLGGPCSGNLPEPPSYGNHICPQRADWGAPAPAPRPLLMESRGMYGSFSLTSVSPVISASHPSSAPVWEPAHLASQLFGTLTASLRHLWGPLPEPMGASLLHNLRGMLPWCPLLLARASVGGQSMVGQPSLGGPW